MPFLSYLMFDFNSWVLLLIQIVLFKQEMHAELSDELGLIQISIKLSENFILTLRTAFVDGNVSGANQPLHANYRNFNLGH